VEQGVQGLAACDQLGAGIGQQEHQRDHRHQALQVLVPETTPVTEHPGIARLVACRRGKAQAFMHE